MKNKRLNMKEESLEADEPLDLSVKKPAERDPEFEEAYDDADAERNLVSEFHSKLLPIKKRNLVRSQSAVPWLDLSRYPGQSVSDMVAADGQLVLKLERICLFWFCRSLAENKRGKHMWW